MAKFKFQTGDKVLARDYNHNDWAFSHFSHADGENYICGGWSYEQCVPYNETTKHLCGTSNPYIDPAEVPAFEFGDVVEIEIYKGSWIKALFLEYSERGHSSIVLVNGCKESRVCRKNHNVRLIRKGNFND